MCKGPEHAWNTVFPEKLSLTDIFLRGDMKCINVALLVKFDLCQKPSTHWKMCLM